MAEMDDDEALSPARQEQKTLGLALRRLREKSGLTQAAAAERFEVSTQAWQRYENGERRFPEHKLMRLAKAAGGSYEDLLMERARLTAPPGAGASVTHLADRGRPFAPPALSPMVAQLAALLGPEADTLRLDHDDLSPWAEGGELIIFDRARPPRRDHGCVVEHADGRMEVAIFTRRDAEGVRVRAAEGPDRLIAAADVRGIYAVRFRGD